MLQANQTHKTAGTNSVVVLGLGSWPWNVLEDKIWVLGLGGQVLGLG